MYHDSAHIGNYFSSACLFGAAPVCLASTRAVRLRLIAYNILEWIDKVIKIRTKQWFRSVWLSFDTPCIRQFRWRTARVDARQTGAAVQYCPVISLYGSTKTVARTWRLDALLPSTDRRRHFATSRLLRRRRHNHRRRPPTRRTNEKSLRAATAAVPKKWTTTTTAATREIEFVGRSARRAQRQLRDSVCGETRDTRRYVFVRDENRCPFTAEWKTKLQTGFTLANM